MPRYRISMTITATSREAAIEICGPHQTFILEDLDSGVTVEGVTPDDQTWSRTMGETFAPIPNELR